MRFWGKYSKNLFVATQFALRAIRSFNTKFNEFMQKTIYNAEMLNELRIYFSNYLNNEKKYKIDPKVGALDLTATVSFFVVTSNIANERASKALVSSTIK